MMEQLGRWRWLAMGGGGAVDGCAQASRGELCRQSIVAAHLHLLQQQCQRCSCILTQSTGIARSVGR